MSERIVDGLDIAGQAFEWGRRTYLMGILNLTPDSFSGDGLGANPESAARQAQSFEPEADILDLGAESTRPNADPVSEEEELARLLPAIAAIRRLSTRPISVDTMKAQVARAALDAGANIINDVTGLADPAMRALVAEKGIPAVVMHMRGTPKTMMQLTDYGQDVVAALLEWFADKLAELQQAGIRREVIILDPGIGFAKTAEQNLEILYRLREFKALGQPLLVGLSRKGFIGHLVAGQGPIPAGHDRDFGTAAGVTMAIAGGADIVRVHNVRALAGAVRVADAITRFPERRK
ncbi:MAG TPA: dihydropteroate synthase [Chloroflexia bacterium]|nr:dihydropteroate synthase [Chloroflexia bacterium]